MPSVFSLIVAGKIPAVKVYEDELTMAFMDINPASPGHVLVIPRQEYADLLSMPPELLSAVTQTVQRVSKAMEKALKPEGFNIIQNNGAAAGQTVFHYHVHIIPRWEGDHALGAWKVLSPEQDDLEATAKAISAQL
jgi:histidine triad (HIT) family protein